MILSEFLTCKVWPVDFLLPCALLFLHKDIAFCSLQFCAIVNLKCRFKIYSSWRKISFASSFRVLCCRWPAFFHLRGFYSLSLFSSQVQFQIPKSHSPLLSSLCLQAYHWSYLKLLIQCPLPSGISYTNWETPELSAILFSIWPIFSIYTLMAIFEDVHFFRENRLLNSTIFLNMHQILLKVSWGKFAFWNVPLCLVFPRFYIYEDRICILSLTLSPQSGNSKGLCPSKK